nr:hypothetical protein [Pseudomonas gessardii]
MSPGTRKRIEELAQQNGWSLDRAVNEIVIEGIAMGGLTMALRPKASLSSINAPPKSLGQKGPTKEPN